MNVHGTYIGIIKQNVDPQSMGRLWVWVPEICGDPTDQHSWLIVSYASPFAGTSSPFNLVKDSKAMAGSQVSYGMWAVPPHLENQVLITFANGDTSKGFWFACLYPQNMNHMVPGLPSNVPTDSSTTTQGALPPVVEYNKWSSVDPDNPQRPAHLPLHTGLTNQGLYPDAERGPSSAGARRESPSQTLGLLSPDQNTIHIDDNPKNEGIRIRTKSGTQVFVNETTGYVYINSKNGNSWIEVSDAGVDIYCSQGISLRSGGDINLHADQNINMNAANINLNATAALTQASGANTEIKVGGDQHIQVSGSQQTSASSNITQQAGGSHARDAGSIKDNTGAATAATAAVAPTKQLTDIQGKPGSYTRTTAATIVSRLPTHEPWPQHPKQGVVPNASTTATTTTGT